ncbi:PLP-dependent aminotransferase family protein [Paenibacillus thalictri]|uniref:PLP-dependent aminotransferase family protein n=1 Tax=Paenibacillus thalictri TaxID=2527873 RepID=A0A4Q9E041_9BACL|nr:PLP-dependent aminotransferase family protein [Paenibacillus thalictri]TBL81790.1 PLP-dependent aminotransferase family protein [Paenibacillus thalictri]
MSGPIKLWRWTVLFHVPLQSYMRQYPGKLDALYHALKDMIVKGDIAYGSRLPSSRELARQYELSRGTVNQAYDMLAADGYVSAGVGRGTFAAYAQRHSQPDGTTAQPITFSAWGRRVQESELRRAVVGTPTLYDFHLGSADVEGFPTEAWNRCLFAEAKAASLDPRHVFEPSQGDAGLRRSIAQYLRRARGISAQPEQIVIVNGSMQAIALLAQLLVGTGDGVIVEEPGYGGIGKAVRSAGGSTIAAELDAEGIIPGNWRSKLLFVTPSRQFPTGVVLSLQRRLELLEWARENGAIIIEDDYDSEFRHRGRPVEPLKALDREGRVVYVGSFSKTLPGFIRVGYAVLPEDLVVPMCKAKELFEPQPTGLLEQKALAAFMQSGHYERHMRRMKRLYGRKFIYLRELLHSGLSDCFEWTEGDAGLHIFGWWKGDKHTYAACKTACGRLGVRWSEAVAGGGDGVESAGGNVRYGAYFNFSKLSLEQMEQGVELMRQAKEDLV